MAWRAALVGVQETRVSIWQTVFRRCGIVLAAAQVVNAVRGVGISRVLRRKLRRARRASARRKRAAEARKALKRAEKLAETQRARAEADAQIARKRAAASSSRPLRDASDPESNRFGVAHSCDGPRDSKWLSGEYEENVPVHVEREIAAAALDEVAMALAAEGDADASAAVAGMALRVAAAESPKKIRLEALANLSSTLSTDLGSNRLVATDPPANGRTSAVFDRASPSAASERATPFSFRSDSNAALADMSHAASVSSTVRSEEARSRDGSHSHESFAASAFEMAARAAAMGDDPEGLTSDEEAQEVEFAERRRAAAAAEAERRHAASEAAIARASAADATAARRASFDEWAAAAGSRDVKNFVGAADDATSVSSYDGSLDACTSDSGSDVSNVEAATEAASAWLAKTRARMRRLSPRKGALFGGKGVAKGGDERDAREPARAPAETDGGDVFAFDRAGVASARRPDASPIGREAARRARALAVSSSDDDETPTRARLRAGDAPGDDDARGVANASVSRREPAAPPTLRLEVLSGVSRGDAVSAPPGVELLTVGRGEARDLCVGDVEVSSSHAEFRWTWFTEFHGDAAGGRELFGTDEAGRTRLGEWRVADVGSTNGTFLNGVAVGGGARGRTSPGREWCPVRHGDEIRLGERAESPALRVSASIEASLAAPAPPLLLRSSARVDPGTPPRLEDRAAAECPLRGCADVALFAVFDGHAGADAAEKARRAFPEILARRLGYRAPGCGLDPDAERSGALDGLEPTAERSPVAGDASSALRDAFLETDASIRCEYEGCAAAALLVWRCAATGDVYAQAANVGDAEISIGRARRGDARRVASPARLVTRAHIIADPAERARLAAAGASLEPGARAARGLRVSRSVGDAFLKRELPGLVATPCVSAPIRLRNDGNDVAVLATRGLWRVADAREATDAATRREDDVSGTWFPATGAARLVELARRRGSGEDVAVVVVRIEDATGVGNDAE